MYASSKNGKYSRRSVFQMPNFSDLRAYSDFFVALPLALRTKVLGKPRFWTLRTVSFNFSYLCEWYWKPGGCKQKCHYVNSAPNHNFGSAVQLALFYGHLWVQLQFAEGWQSGWWWAIMERLKLSWKGRCCHGKGSSPLICSTSRPHLRLSVKLQHGIDLLFVPAKLVGDCTHQGELEMHGGRKTFLFTMLK